ncbi:MAG: Rrf2 family transcriptional regulator [Candidatus Omnitrophica bacterium]|nr:Rrf2 family transcriptional regulator [Candidatus Omnitrophota bacterium]
MKLITRDTDYAIRALGCIAVSKKEMVTAGQLVKELDIPRPFLRKILQALNKKGILRSCKGKDGGFSLAAKSADINVLEIIEIFQGPFQLNEHLFKGKTCPNIDTCKFKKRTDKMEQNMRKDLEAITIKDVLK